MPRWLRRRYSVPDPAAELFGLSEDEDLEGEAEVDDTFGSSYGAPVDIFGRSNDESFGAAEGGGDALSKVSLRPEKRFFRGPCFSPPASSCCV